MDAELAEQVLRVCSHGIYRYPEIDSDSSTIVTRGHTVEDLSFSHRQAGQLLVEEIRGWVRPLHLLHESADETTGHPTFVACERSHRAHEIGDWAVHRRYAARPRAQSSDQSRTVVGAEDRNDRNGWLATRPTRGQLEARYIGQVHVEHNHARVEHLDRSAGGDTGGRDAGDTDSGRTLEVPCHRIGVEPMAVDHQNAHRPHRSRMHRSEGAVQVKLRERDYAKWMSHPLGPARPLLLRGSRPRLARMT
jgi:hypothetical protein